MGPWTTGCYLLVRRSKWCFINQYAQPTRRCKMLKSRPNNTKPSRINQNTKRGGQWKVKGRDLMEVAKLLYKYRGGAFTHTGLFVRTTPGRNVSKSTWHHHSANFWMFRSKAQLLSSPIPSRSRSPPPVQSDLNMGSLPCHAGWMVVNPSPKMA